VRYSFLLLDLDGTLIDSFADIAASVEPALASVGKVLARGDIDGHIRRGAPLEELWAAAGAGDGFDAFCTAYRSHYLPRCMDTTVAFAGVLDTLAVLKAHPTPPVIAVATAKRTDTAERMVEATGLARYVDVVAGSEGIPAKPDPAVIHRAAERAGRTLEGALMVGDTERDVLAARAAGVRAAWLDHGHGYTWASQAADYRLASFAELLGVMLPG
jgi:phosphoglycolate phosphatase